MIGTGQCEKPLFNCLTGSGPTSWPACVSSLNAVHNWSFLTDLFDHEANHSSQFKPIQRFRISPNSGIDFVPPTCVPKSLPNLPKPQSGLLTPRA
jgi:hypothetical protein